MNRQIPDQIILHDYLQVNGGAERLVISLAKGLSEFSLGVGGIYPEFAQSGDLMGIVPYVLSNKLSFLPRVPRSLLTFSKNSFFSETTKCVIYSGIYSPLAVKNQSQGKKILYCHTPPRFAFDRESEYTNKLNGVVRPWLKNAIAAYRKSYLESISLMDSVVTNSQHVRKRLYNLTGVDSTVIYPPVDLTRFRWLGQSDYYLSLGRLEPNKRVDRLIHAFLRMPEKKLVVASGGSQLKSLRKLACGADNIFFTGWIDDRSLSNRIGNAIACLYIPRDEDFGMSTLEAMSAGKPVIGVDEGGLKETIDHNRTGVLLFRDPSVECICDAVRMLGKVNAIEMRGDCESRAKLFSLDRFISRMNELIHLPRLGK